MDVPPSLATGSSATPSLDNPHKIMNLHESKVNKAKKTTVAISGQNRGLVQLSAVVTADLVLIAVDHQV